MPHRLRKVRKQRGSRTHGWGRVGQHRGVLAIIRHNELHGDGSYGYNIWSALKEKFYCYMDKGNLRNVYRHLEYLRKVGLVDVGKSQLMKGAPARKVYTLTEKGRWLEEKYSKYLEVLYHHRAILGH